MSEQATAAEKIPVSAKIIFILLAGSLSMFFAEVLSGSSVLWFATPWAWLVTFWLYLAHFVLFLNLAFIFKRTSLPALYLWGVLFGLYEAWITKVTWAGYMGSAPGWGTVLGFAFPEFPLIVFFWHPVFSFILPVLCFEALAGREKILAGHRPLLAKTRRNWLLALAFVLIGAVMLSFNAKGNVVAVVVTLVGSVIISGILYWLASRRYGQHFSLGALRLGKIGLAVFILYMALLYLLTFFFLLPERIAPPITILLTLAVYAVIVLLLYLKKPYVPVSTDASPGKGFFGLKEIALLLVLLLVLGVIFSLLTPVDFILIIALYLGLVFIAPVLFLLAVWSVWKGRRRASSP